MSTEKNAPGPTSTGRAEPPRQGGTELQDTPSLPAWCVKGASFIDAEGNPWLVVERFSAEESRGGPGAVLVQMVTRQPCTVWIGSPTITSARDILPPEGELIEAAELISRQEPRVAASHCDRCMQRRPQDICTCSCAKCITPAEPASAREDKAAWHRRRSAFVRETAARILSQTSHLTRVCSEEELVTDCVRLSAALLFALDEAGYGFDA